MGEGEASIYTMVWNVVMLLQLIFASCLVAGCAAVAAWASVALFATGSVVVGVVGLLGVYVGFALLFVGSLALIKVRDGCYCGELNICKNL